MNHRPQKHVHLARAPARTRSASLRHGGLLEQKIRGCGERQGMAKLLKIGRGEREKKRSSRAFLEFWWWKAQIDDLCAKGDRRILFSKGRLPTAKPSPPLAGNYLKSFRPDRERTDRMASLAFLTAWLSLQSTMLRGYYYCVTVLWYKLIVLFRFDRPSPTNLNSFQEETATYLHNLR